MNMGLLDVEYPIIHDVRILNFKSVVWIIGVSELHAIPLGDDESTVSPTFDDEAPYNRSSVIIALRRYENMNT